ncbi:MAG: hypothetical protein HYU87_06960 [Chloroflexi bacterium]|nr:hypothetical protein [Chloroflexota bacterium]
MDAADVERTLRACEDALTERERVDLSSLGFWKAVSAAKRDPQLVARYGERIARIDRAAFERTVRLRFPAALGVAVDLAGAAVGIGLMALTFTGSPATAPFWALHPWKELMFLAGMGAVIGTTHTLAHWIVGRLAGIRFTHWFTVPPAKPQPGFKIDYASYLRTPAAARAWMHASGAIVTKVVPFAAYPFALSAGLEPWAIWVVLGVGVLQLVTDALFSVRASDWKKFRREIRLAG